MRRRLPKPATPLNQKQDELARRESELRDKMQQLERMIAEAPRVAEETHRRHREEIMSRASECRSRLDVSVALQDKRFDDSGSESGRRVALRKEKREGRLIFLVLVIALATAVIWLMSHFQF